MSMYIPSIYIYIYTKGEMMMGWWRNEWGVMCSIVRGGGLIIMRTFPLFLGILTNFSVESDDYVYGCYVKGMCGVDSKSRARRAV